MFTAIAMVAFMGSSIANTIENNEKELSFLKTQEELGDFKKTDCVKVANALIVLHEYTTAWENVVTWIIIYNNCEATSN